MELSLVIAQALIKMLILLVVGFLLTKKGILTEERCKVITDLLVKILIPSLVVVNFCKGSTPETKSNMIIALFLVACGMAILILCGKLIPKKGNPHWRLDRGIASYPNVGFIALPLIQSVYGSEGMLYSAACVGVYNMFQWSFGQILMEGKFNKESFIRAMTTPVMCSSYVGLFVFFANIKVPSLITTPLQYMGDCCIALPMFIIGSAIARCKVKETFKEWQAYLSLAIKLLIGPIIIAVLLKFVQVDEIVKMDVLISMSAPPATATSMLALQFGQDDGYPSTLLAVGTVLCAISIPLVVLIYGLI